MPADVIDLFPRPSSISPDEWIDTANTILEGCREHGGEGLIFAIEAAVIDNMVRREPLGIVHGALNLVYCVESLFGPLPITIRPKDGEAGAALMSGLPPDVKHVRIGDRWFVAYDETG